MSSMKREWPYPVVQVDGSVYVDEDGEDQVCECGNDSWTEDWMHADSAGNLALRPNGSADPAEFAVCPVCGRVYANCDLFTLSDSRAPAIARYDTTSEAFARARDWYQSNAYG